MSLGTVLVTGAAGFVGAALCERLRALGANVRAFVRRPGSQPAADQVVVGDVSSFTGWHEALSGVDAVVHLAARVHLMDDAAADPLAQYRKVNRDAVLKLTEAAVHKGVSHLVLLSTVKVHGERTTTRPFREDDALSPTDPYAVSKLEAEEGMRAIAAGTGLKTTVLRPPLVYGPGVRANFLRLARLARRGAPLPLGLVNNRRSLVGRDNLVEAILTCLEHDGAADETFLVADGEAVSTRALYRMLLAAFGRRTFLPPVPPSWLRLAGRLAGRGGEVARLTESLEVDAHKIARLTGWRPAKTLEQGIAEVARRLEETEPA